MAERQEGKNRRTAQQLKSHLVEAVTDGNLEKWKEIVSECGVDNGEREKLLNSLFDEDCTLLHIASLHNQVSIINWLLSKKEGEGRSLGLNKALAKDCYGRTALHLAVWKGHIETCKAIVNGLRVDNGERQEMLNAVDVRDYTILHQAVERRQVPIISWILSEEGGRAAGFDSVLARTQDGDTALDLAANVGNLRVFVAVVNGLRVDNGERQEMLNAVDVRDYTILHQAVERRQVPIISWILSEEGGRAAGFDSVLARTQDGDTALHMATGWTGDLESFLAIVNGCRVDNGERREMLTAVDSQQYTILHLAVQSKQLPLVSWILSDEGGRAAGFGSVLSRTKEGDTALDLAANVGNLRVFVAVVNGCRVDNGERQEMLNAVDKKGKTAFHRAAKHECKEIIKWILSEEGGRAAGFNGVLAKTTDDFFTALHFAVLHSSPDSTRVLLSHCTSEERMNLFLAIDKHGWTALHCAARQTNANQISLLLSYPECGSIVNMKDNRGMTALHRAIIGGLDKESRKEWAQSASGISALFTFRPDRKIVRSLLGLSGKSSSSSTTTTEAKAWIDPNIGLGLL